MQSDIYNNIIVSNASYRTKEKYSITCTFVYFTESFT